MATRFLVVSYSFLPHMWEGRPHDKISNKLIWTNSPHMRPTFFWRAKKRCLKQSVKKWKRRRPTVPRKLKPSRKTTTTTVSRKKRALFYCLKPKPSNWGLFLHQQTTAAKTPFPHVELDCKTEAKEKQREESFYKSGNNNDNNSNKQKQLKCEGQICSMPFLPFLKDENNFRLVVSGGKRGEGAKWHPSRLVFAVRKKEKPLWFSAAAFSWQSAVSIFRFPIKIVGRELEARAILELFFPPIAK